MATETTSQRSRDDQARDDTARLADEARNAAKEQAGALWDDARHAARSKLDEQKTSAAGHLGDLASALRAAAQQLEGKEQGGAARLTESAAGGLDRLSGTLREKDLDGMLRDAEAFARRQPVTFFAAAMVAGFVAVRFLKSSESAGDTQDASADEDQRYDQREQQHPFGANIARADEPAPYRGIITADDSQSVYGSDGDADQQPGSRTMIATDDRGL